MDKFTLNLTDELKTILEKARDARTAYDRVMRETRGDILNPAAKLSTLDLNKRNEAKEKRAVS